MTVRAEVFNGAQTFFIDPTKVAGAQQVMISAINLYFKHKPAINANFSGASTPGVTLFIAETVYGVPRISRQSGIFNGEGIARVGYFDIQTSSDASIPTTFRFNMPVLVDTDKEYAFIWRFDQLDQFVLWTSKQGDILVGTTNQVSSGPSGKYTGNYFDFFNMFIADDTTDLDQYLKNWRPVSDVDLKFDVYLARFAHSGYPVGANSSIDVSLIHENELANTTYTSNITNFDIKFGSYEYVSYNQANSVKYAFVGGQRIFQNTFSYPGGYIATKTSHAVNCNSGNVIVTANTTLPNSSAFVWSDIFTANSNQKVVVFKSGNNYNIRNVVAILSNTQIRVDEPLTFTNSAAQFMITPTGTVSGFDKNSPFGISESFVQIANSTANSTVRFVNSTIESISITAGGSGYSNGDILYINGWEEVTNKVRGGYAAKANLVTNSTGGITDIYFSNLGCGFSNTAAMSATIANSTSANTTSNTSAGSGATFSYTVGATLLTELTPNIFRECKVRNLDVSEFIPYLELKNPPGSDYTFQIDMPYYKTTDAAVIGNNAYYVSANSEANRITLSMYATNYTESVQYVPVLPSKSNEYVIRYSDGSVNDKITNADSYSSVAFRLVGNVSSNSDYTCAMIKGLPSVHFSKYIVNNDYTNEHTDSGNAMAKHITKIFNFDRPAEDIRVFLTAYNPSNCDIKVYARIYKNEDPDAFDDKDWTLLELKGIPPRSSMADTSDYVEQTYGFYQYPQDRTVLTGIVSTSLSSATVTGSNTLFESELSVGSLVLLRQELFPNNHIVAVVNSITSNTSLTLTEAITNTSLVAEGLKIDKFTYPNQAFNNIQKDNVVRYHNTSNTKFDGYDKAMIKVVFLSDTPHRTSRIDSIQVVGLSA